VKTKLALDDAQIGVALFCLALGILIFLPLIPYLSKKIGVGRLTVSGVLLFSVAFIAPVVMQNYSSLCISLFVVGVFSGITDVAMNALVSEIEKKHAVNIMSSAHGFFSLGGVLGATLGSFLMPIFNQPVYHMISISGLVILVNIVLAKHYFFITEQQHFKEKTTFSFTKLKPLLTIAFIAVIVMGSEGAIEHWSGLYLLEIVKITQQNLAGIGFIIFSVMMTIGRFFGDGISHKIGSMKTISLGCLLAIFGYLCVLASQFVLTVFGYGIVGLGLSVVIPELFRMAGNTSGVKASVGISIVSGIGFLGFLFGPVILGIISNKYDLKISFLTVLILTCFALLIAGLKLRKTETN
tara:strand:- start:1161 stop:2219 length:1059 start_codon:yes stop_codon:yes gene_type:complete